MDVSAKDLAKNKFKSHRKYSRGGRGQRSGRDDNFERLVPEVGSNAHR